jgi:hypothetical protein
MPYPPVVIPPDTMFEGGLCAVKRLREIFMPKQYFGSKVPRVLTA